MYIRQVEQDQKTKYMDLLLLADEAEEMIGKYLFRGDMFALYDGDLTAICVVTEEGSGVYELKNIATRPEYQRMGYGKYLIAFVVNRYRGKGKTLLVGTGDTPEMNAFYKSCGFVYSHTVKNFFVDNYSHPIIDNGVVLTDMMYMKQSL